VYKSAQNSVPDDPLCRRTCRALLKLGDTALYLDYVKKAVINKQLDAENQLDILTDFVQNLLMIPYYSSGPADR